MICPLPDILVSCFSKLVRKILGTPRSRRNDSYKKHTDSIGILENHEAKMPTSKQSIYVEQEGHVVDNTRSTGKHTESAGVCGTLAGREAAGNSPLLGKMFRHILQRCSKEHGYKLVRCYFAYILKSVILHGKIQSIYEIKKMNSK